MQHLKNFNWKKFLLQGVLPFLLAVAVGFISRYQLELSDGVAESFLQLQWPLYAPLNALTAFCLTLILFALLGKWSRATGISGAVFTVIALINYYTRDLHGLGANAPGHFEPRHRRRGHGQLHPENHAGRCEDRAALPADSGDCVRAGAAGQGCA